LADPRTIDQGINSSIGGERVLELPYGEDLPRIC
jgi:hypothetical protein